MYNMRYPSLTCGASSVRSVVEITSGISFSSLLVPRAHRTSPRPGTQKSDTVIRVQL